MYVCVYVCICEAHTDSRQRRTVTNKKRVQVISREESKSTVYGPTVRYGVMFLLCFCLIIILKTEDLIIF